MKVKLSNVEAEYLETKDVNETHLSDVENLNEWLELLIPGRAEDMIDELRESNAILKKTLQKYEEDFENKGIEKEKVEDSEQ